MDVIKAKSLDSPPQKFARADALPIFVHLNINS